MGFSIFPAQWSRWKRISATAVGVIILYTIFGFFIAPSIVKHQLISGIAENLNRSATVEEIKVNPFALSVTVTGFDMTGLKSEPFVGFKELYINFQLSSIFRGAFTFAHIRLVGLDSSVQFLPDGQLNFSDLLAPDNTPEQKAEESNVLPAILVFHLQIEDGRLLFSDLSKPTPFNAEFRPLGLSLENFSTKKDSDSPYAFVATMGSGGTLSWEGELSVNPLRSRGRLGIEGIQMRALWEYLQDQVPFEIRDGTINVGGEYIADLSGQSPRFEIANGIFELDQLKIAEKGKEDIVIAVPNLSVEGVDVNLSETKATLGLVRSSDAKVKGWIASDGTFNLNELFAMDVQEKTAETLSEPSKQTEPPSPPWLFQVKEVILDNYGVFLENRTLVKPLKLDLAPISANLKDLSNEKNAQAVVSLDFTVNQKGTVEITGPTTINPISADLALKVNQFALTLWQPYVDAVAQLNLVSGAVGLDGQLKYKALGADGPEIRYAGTVRVTDFEVKNPEHTEDFLKWKALSCRKLIFDYAPTRLSIAEILAQQPYARVMIWPDKTVNVATVVVPPEKQKAVFAVTDRAVEAIKAEKGTMPITIDQVRIENGSAHFADFFMKPNFATGVYDLQGTVKGLSSDPSARADVLLNGKVDKHAPVKIAGQVNPLSPEAYADMALSFKNIELTTFTPYSGRFMGYAIEKGKLSLDLKYKLSENRLEGENKVLFNQLTLGDQIDSPDATKLPVRLAIALLRDRNGKIDLDLPVQGDLNDPEFSYGRIIVKAVVNLLTKIVTSPFTLLGKLVGGDGEAMRYVDFEFGSPSIRADQAEKLDKLAEALVERPSLQIEIKGTADLIGDKKALAEASLRKQLKRMRYAELGFQKKESPPNLEEISLSNEDITRLLIQAYEERFGEHPKTLVEKVRQESQTGQQGTDSTSATQDKRIDEPPVEPQMIATLARQRLIDDIRIDELSLRKLAQDRALEIKGHLLQQQIPDERIFLLDVELVDSSEKDTARANLTLDGG